MHKTKTKALAFLSVVWLTVAVVNVALAEVHNSGEQLLNKFETLTVASGDFKQRKYFKILKHPILSRGEVHLEKNLGLVWQTNSPVFARMLLRNDGLYTDSGLGANKQIKGGDALAQVLMQAMVGDSEGLLEQFDVTTSEQNNCVLLVPQKKHLAQIIRAIAICGDEILANVAANSSAIKHITVYEHSENRTEIDLELSPLISLTEAVREQLQ